MHPTDVKIRRTLAVIHAAIANPEPLPLREANDHAAALLDELDPWTQRRGVAELTLALRALNRVLASNDRG